ncbi:MFS-type transporter-like protein 60 [Elsinoe fawcettii]|nr:MFS-type transporter-like protein 60 [Elsinoe fawcettii]
MNDQIEKETAVREEKKQDSPVTSDLSSDEDADDIRERILAQREQDLHNEPPRSSLTSLLRRKKDKIDLDGIATQHSVFDDPATAKFFAPHPRYENLHRFDPTTRWTWREEKAIVRKIDWRITIWACIAFFSLDLGRGNINQANTDDFLPDLGMDTNDFNLGNTVYQVSFLCAELPSQMISKKVGPDRWIPFLIMSWSIAGACQFWLSGRSSFLALRCILGLLHGGFIPDIVLYLTYFFKSSELPFRLAIFWTVRRITDIVAPIMAFGILRMRGVLGRSGWRWLFLIEGCLTFLIGVWSWFMMAASPTQTKAWYRPDGWFDEREEKIMTNRILRDDPSKGDMHNRQAINLKMLWRSLKDFDLLPIYIIGLCWEMPAGPPDQYLTLTLRNLGFDTFDANLLSIPTQFVGAITMLIMTYISEVVDQRAIFGIFTQAWIMPNLTALAVLPSSRSPWAEFAVVTVLLSYPSPHAMHVGWASRNSNSVRTRAVSAALYNMAVQLSRVIYSNIYRQDDRPEYRRGNRQLLAICAMNMVIYTIVKVWYMWRNKTRQKKWDGMSTEQRIEYLTKTSDRGNKRLDFRFVH